MSIVGRWGAVLAALLTSAGLLAPAPASAGDDLPVPYTFLTSAVTAGTRVDADPPGANLWDCAPSARHPRPVVLVHGTLGNKNTNWQTYAPLLKNHGYCVFALTYGVPAGTPPGLDQFGGLARMQDSAEQLGQFVAKVLRRTGARQVDVIGHSQGTVVPEYWAKFLGGARYVHDYISLAPLWHGTRIADPLTLPMAAFGLSEDQVPLCTACAQFRPASEFMTRLRAGGLKVGRIDYTNIVTRYDELVAPYTSGIQRGMRNVVLQDLCDQDFSEHFEIAASPTAAQVVLNTLDPAHAQPVTCRLVLPFVGS